MYSRDMPVIRDHALSCPDGLVDVITFTLLTIQQHLGMVAESFADVKQHHETSIHLWGSKRDGYRYAVEHKEVLFGAITSAVKANDAVGAVDVLLNVPNLGLVKAAFVAQMCGLQAACLDTHNLIRAGLPYTAVKFHKAAIKTPKTRLAKIRRYLELCANLGGSEKLWNDWCEYVAGRETIPAMRSRMMHTASDVSKAHVLSMGLRLPVEACPF